MRKVDVCKKKNTVYKIAKVEERNSSRFEKEGWGKGVGRGVGHDDH